MSQDSTCRYPYITTAATKTAYTHRDQETKRPTDQSAILRPIGIQLAESIGRGWQSTTTTTLQQQYFFLSLTVTSESIHPSSHYYYYFCYCTLLQFWSDDDKLTLIALLTAVQSTFDPIEELYNFSINTGWERGNGEKELKKAPITIDTSSSIRSCLDQLNKFVGELSQFEELLDSRIHPGHAIRIRSWLNCTLIVQCMAAISQPAMMMKCMHCASIHIFV